MTPRPDPDNAYARRLVELSRMEREGEIVDLQTGGDLPVITSDCALLGGVRVHFRYLVPGKGLHLEIEPGQSFNAADVIKAVYRGFTVTEVAA